VSDVAAAATIGKPCAFREVRTVKKRIYELRDLGRIG